MQTPRAAKDVHVLAPSMPSLLRDKPRCADCFENENENDKDDVWKTVPVEIAPFELPRPPEIQEVEPREVALLRQLPFLPDNVRPSVRPPETMPFEALLVCLLLAVLA